MLPYFRRAETRADGGDEYRGDRGPLQTSNGTLANPLHAAWLEAATQAGYPAHADVNGFQQEGFGRLDMTVGGGRRSQRRQCLSAAGHAAPQSRTCARTRWRRAILFEGSARGRRAISHAAATIDTVRARREVIVCAGLDQLTASC